jgi:hypothetical protein
MVLRVSQCIFAAASVCAMLTAFLFSESPAFFYLMDSPALWYVYVLPTPSIILFSSHILHS